MRVETQFDLNRLMIDDLILDSDALCFFSWGIMESRVREWIGVETQRMESCFIFSLKWSDWMIGVIVWL